MSNASVCTCAAAAAILASVFTALAIQCLDNPFILDDGSKVTNHRQASVNEPRHAQVFLTQRLVHCAADCQ